MTHVMKTIAAYFWVPNDGRYEKSRVASIRLVNIYAGMNSLLCVSLFVAIQLLFGSFNRFDVLCYSLICLASGVVYLFVPFVNRMGYITVTKLFVIASACMASMGFAIALGPSSGMNVLFFSIITYPFMFFTLKERKQIVVSILFMVLCCILSFVPHPGVSNIFARIDPVSAGYNALIAYITTMILIGAIVFFFSYTNAKHEDELIEASVQLKLAAEADQKKAAELSASNQQLKANEQQLRTLNQQLQMYIHKEIELAGKAAVAEIEKKKREELESLNHELVAKEQALQASRGELTSKLSHIEKINKVMVGRELAMIELKKRVNSLLAELGRDAEFGDL
jgi:hypothetical protein